MATLKQHFTRIIFKSDTAVDIQATGKVTVEGSSLHFTLVTPANVPQTTPDAQDVIDALISLGLVEQSDPVGP